MIMIGFRCLGTEVEELTDEEKIQLDITKAGTRALWSMSASCRNREAMRKHGIIPLLQRLLKSIHIDIAIPTIGTLQECASESSFQLAIQTEGMVPDIVKHLYGENTELMVSF